MKIREKEKNIFFLNTGITVYVKLSSMEFECVAGKARNETTIMMKNWPRG
jgi:hypothetical protein